jgi:protein kinase C substrate 80K-H
LSRVNDGICDYDICCDGSDEYLGVGGIACPSRCKEIGTAARKMAAERYARRSKGAKARDELLKKAKVLRKELLDNVATSKLMLEATEVKLKDLRAKLAETERREKLKAAQNPAEKKPVEVVTEKAKETIAELKTMLAKVKEQRDAAEARLVKTEAVLSVLKEEYNPNFNDEGVKRAVRAWEEYLAENNVERDKAEDAEVYLAIDGEIDWEALVPVEEPKPERTRYFFFLWWNY